MDVFERVKIRLQSGKDFPPEMVEELVKAYESRLAQISSKLTPHAVDGAYTLCFCGTTDLRYHYTEPHRITGTPRH